MTGKGIPESMFAAVGVESAVTDVILFQRRQMGLVEGRIPLTEARELTASKLTGERLRSLFSDEFEISGLLTQRRGEWK